MIKAVVFDLDGTLADTASLGGGRRIPSQLIIGGVSEAGVEVSPRPWAWSREVSDIPAILIERGYWVGVATRAPLAYASTLLHLIDADYHCLKASCGGGLAKAGTLVQLCREFGIAAHEMVYCGDLLEDRDIATQAGVSFLNADSLRDDAILEKFPRLLNGRGNMVKIDGGPKPSSNSNAGEHFLWFDYTSSLKVGPISQSELNSLDTYLQLVESSGESAETRAAMSADLLLKFPALPCRRQLQIELFSNVGPGDRDEILSGPDRCRFGPRPRLITRRELRIDTELRDKFLSALLQVWQPIQGSPDQSISAAVCFDQDDWYIGKMLGRAKDYKRHNARDGRMRSGPEVLLEPVGFVSALIASRFDPHVSRPLVPIPSSGYSDHQPGQLSTRVARQVADLKHRELLPILRRLGDDYEVNPHFPREHLPSNVDLIDDQITTGGTVNECREALEREGVRVSGVYCYSANLRVLSNFSRPDPVTIETRLQSLQDEHWGY